LVNQRLENEDEDESTFVSNAFRGFLNYGGTEGLNLDFGGNFIIDDGTGETDYEADRTVLFTDRPERALRFEAGNLFTNVSTTAGASDFLGIGVRKSYRELQPTRILQPLGQRSFRLDRPGEVTVLVDDQVVSRFDAPAGEINLNEIPLASVSNRVQIIVEDEFGRQEMDSFSVVSDALLLEPGLSEYSFGIGQRRRNDAFGFSYTDDVVAGGNYQRAINSGWTQGAYGYLSSDLSIAGTTTVVSALKGIAQVELGYSDSDATGGGFAGSVNYRWSSAQASARSQSLAFTLDYREEEFNSVGSELGSDTKFNAAAFYERQITDDLRINASASYREEYSSEDPFENFAAGASYQAGQFIIGGGMRFSSFSGRDDEVSGFLTITRRFGKRRTASARYDSANNAYNFRYRQPSQNEVGSVGFNADLETQDDELLARGAVDYTANRYRARVGLRQSGEDSNFNGDTQLSGRFQTGLAFADGKFGIGRDPGRGFVMVERHRSLSDAQVEIASRGRRSVQAKTGLLGPAVARVNAPFVSTVTRLNVKNAPIGYNLGDGSYFSAPGARAGVKITVGSDAFRSAVGTFMFDGEPMGLATATLTNLKTGNAQVTFTNRAGRALLSNLEPGVYSLEFTGTDLVYQFEIDDESEVYFDLGRVDLIAGEMP
jgi:outer membrane usher protein FimD/PapC